MRNRNRVTVLLALVIVPALVATSGGRAAAQPAHARIEGTGSSWSANAVNQWIADVAQQGMQVVYTPTGSAVGRKDFGFRTTDFAVSDIPFQGRDKLTGEVDDPRGRSYAYLPIVAGGTSFPYQIRVGGQLVRNLRLSGETIAKIFTNQITNWNDPQITADNNGRRLPSLPIIPVVHVEGSGATHQFTRYLANRYGSIWSAWAGSNVPTEYFPRTSPGKSTNIIALEKSDGVMNFVVSKAGNGAIGYNEYSYALAAGYPVAKLQNANGYFTLPTDFNVAVSLTSARINDNPSSPEYLIQNLDDVYVKADNRTYPLSSYSYFILPTGRDGDAEPKMTTAKRQTIADFLSYSVCTGQRAMGPIGYSPLPINLVQASFDQIKKLRDADSKVVIDQKPVDRCNNPTFVAGQPQVNHLAQIAPMPAACDKVGAGPCAAEGSQGGGPSEAAGPGGGGGAAGTGGPGASNQPGAATSADASAAAAGAQIDPETGLPVGANGGGSNANAIGTPTDLASFAGAKHIKIISVVIAVLLLAVLIAPPLLRRRLTSRRTEEEL